MPLRAHIKERAILFKQFEAIWTPTVLVLDVGGEERYRIEGYSPPDEFNAQLRMGVARVHFMRKQWPDAEAIYGDVLASFGQTRTAAAALYWQGVCRYKRSRDHADLVAVHDAFEKQYSDSFWARKASMWDK